MLLVIECCLSWLVLLIVGLVWCVSLFAFVSLVLFVVFTLLCTSCAFVCGSYLNCCVSCCFILIVA